MNDFRDIVDFHDSDFTALPQHHQRLLIRGENAAAPSVFNICGVLSQHHQRNPICMKPDLQEFAAILWQCQAYGRV